MTMQPVTSKGIFISANYYALFTVFSLPLSLAGCFYYVLPSRLYEKAPHIFLFHLRAGIFINTRAIEAKRFALRVGGSVCVCVWIFLPFTLRATPEIALKGEQIRFARASKETSLALSSVNKCES